MHSGFHPLLGVVGILHGLFALSFALGVLLLFIWAIRHLSAQKMKSVALWMIGIGFVGCILTIGLWQMTGERWERGQGMMDREGNFKEGRWMMGGRQDQWDGFGDEEVSSASSSARSSAKSR